MTASDTESVISHLPALLTDLTRRGDDTDPDRFGRLRPSGRYALVSLSQDVGGFFP
jgi:hypothetical protein